MKKKFQDPTRRDYMVGILILVVYLIILGGSAYFLIPKHWGWWAIIFISSTIVMIVNQNRKTANRCRACGEEFEVSLLKNLTSLHGVDQKGSWQMIKCPSCDTRSKTTVIKIRR